MSEANEMTIIDAPLRVAVVGGGPAGMYAADALTLGEDPGTEVDIIERLPVPFGLLRYGVAPDHLKIKAAASTLTQVLERPQVRLMANVSIGSDITVEELRSCYDVVFYALGASSDRALGVPGEDLAGSLSATSFVSWYNGHPDRVAHVLHETTSVAVIGVGNVALDVARILLAEPEALEHTDMPHDVIEELRRSAVTDVHVFGRRAARFAKFTSKELREIGELDNVDVIVDAPSLDAGPDPLTANVKRNLAILDEWSQRSSQGRLRRLHMHFQCTPHEIVGDDRVRGLHLKRMDDAGQPTGASVDVDVDLVLRSVGYSAVPIPGLPFDPATNTIPTQDHRVVRDGVVSVGEYAVGWIKRGPTGVLGTNRKDATETIAVFRNDVEHLKARRTQVAPRLDALAAERGLRPIDLSGWNAILDVEGGHGAAHSRGRVKLTDWEMLVAAAGMEVVESRASRP